MLQPSDEIKQKIDIVDLIREYIPIKPAGLNFRGTCPFHREKTPSFMVSPEKQIWHCFGCGKGGDVFSFVMEIENVEFAEALRILAPKAGVVLKRQDPKASSQRDRLLDILELSRRYFHRVLLTENEAQPARVYLEKRGLDKDTIEEWQIGYSLNSWDSVLNFLRKNGFNDNEIFLAGMSIKGTSRPGFYDRFRGRIMFPINEINGNTVGFSARVSPDREAEEVMGKYINSPQTIIYDKSKILFGLDKAKHEIKKKDAVIIVEGQMDAITAHQFGYKNTVASSGTALSTDQVNLISKRYTKNLIFALDSDIAGQLAVDRGADTASRENYAEIVAEDSKGRTTKYIDPLLANNINIKIIAIPEGKDPDECIRKNFKEWQIAAENPIPIMQYHFEKILAGKDVDNVENKRQIAREFLGKIMRLADKIEADYWLKRLSEKIGISENILRETMQLNIKNDKNQSGKIVNNKRENEINLSREERLSELLLSLMIKYDSLLEFSITHFQPYYFIGQNIQILYKNLLFYYNNNNISENFLYDVNGNKQFDFSNFRSWLDEEGNKNNDITSNQIELLDKLALLGDSEFYDFEPEQAKIEAIKHISVLKKFYLLSRMNELEKLIDRYEKEKNSQAVEQLMGEFKILSDELNGVK
jgi:DNA primase